MKNLKYLVLLLLLFPITVCAKTPNKEETIKVIESIENVQVDEGIIIYSAEVEDKFIKLNMSDNGITTEKDINYEFKDKELIFTGGKYSIENNEVKEVSSNDYAFYLYSILENKSTVPYDIDNYYNKTNIEKKIKSFTEESKTYIENSKTFGLTLAREKIGQTELINVSYHYYFDGDYPILIKEEITDELQNPDTGNYTILISVMLFAVLIIGIYTYLDIPSKRIKGE